MSCDVEMVKVKGMRPCPFCGGDPWMMVEPFELDTTRCMAWGGCTCGGDGPRVTGSDYDDAVGKAVDLWNGGCLVLEACKD